MVDPVGRSLSLEDLKQYFRLGGISLDHLQNRFSLIRWLVPALLFLLVTAYELGPSRWINDRFGFTYHLAAEILFFAIIGPTLAFALLDMARRWLDERDTSDWQARLLTRAREDALRSRQLNDDAVQVLFATGTMFKAIKADGVELPAESAAQIDAAEKALDQAISRLREHLSQE